MSSRRRPPAECPVCGEAVPPSARSRPHCGADERSGWNEDETRYDGLDLPDSAFDDDDADSRDSRRRQTPRPRTFFTAPVALAVAVVLAALIAWSLLGFR